jgi:hypothetical protein
MRDKAQEILNRRVTEYYKLNRYETEPYDVSDSIYLDAMEEYAAILVDKERAKHEFSK